MVAGRGSIPVEEMRVDDGGDEPPDRRLPPNTRHRWPLIAAGVGVAAVIGAAAFAIGADDDDDEAEPDAGSTTTAAPGPVVPVQTSDELRLLVTALPADHQLTGYVDNTPQPGDAADGTTWLYAAQDATANGPWLTVVVAARGSGPLDADFQRPGTAVDIGGVPAATGVGPDGLETTRLVVDEQWIHITADGLPAGTTVDAARALSMEPGSVSIDSTVLDRLGVGQVGGDVSALNAIAHGGALAGAVFEYSSVPGAGPRIEAAVLPVVPGQSDPASEEQALTILLRGAHQVDLAGRQALAGSTWPPAYQRGTPVITWRVDDLRIVLRGDVDEELLLTAARSVVLPGDPGWSEAAWRQAMNELLEAQFDVMAEARSVAAEAPRSVVIGRGPTGAGSEWIAHLVIDDAVTGYTISTGPTYGVSSAWTRGPLTITVFQNASAEAGEAPVLGRWTVVAIANLEAPATATLRVTTDGTPAAETPLASIDDLDGYVATVIGQPFTSTFTVELVAADGTVLERATDLDVLPAT